MIASFAFSLYAVGSRYLITRKKYSPLTLTGASIIFSAIGFLFISIFTSHKNFLMPIFNLNNFLVVSYSAIFVTIITYLLFQWAIKHSSATTATLNLYLQPVFAILLNFIFLGERITAGFFFGAAFVFIGVFLSTSTQLITLGKKVFLKFVK